MSGLYEQVYHVTGNELILIDKANAIIFVVNAKFGILVVIMPTT